MSAPEVPPPISYPLNLGDRFNVRQQQQRPSISVDDEVIQRVSTIEDTRTHSLKIARTPDLDAYLRKLGSPGRFQIVTYVLLSLGYCIVATNNLASIFYSVEPAEYLCTNEEFMAGTIVMDALSTTASQEGSRGVTQVVKITKSTPMNGVTRVEQRDWNDRIFLPDDLHQCIMIKNITIGRRNHSQKSHCTEWRFPAHSASVVTEFQLLCDKAWLVNFATTIYFIGVMLGAIVFGAFSDRFGRRLTLLISSSGSVLLGIATAFSPNYIAFVVFRFFLGIFVQGVQGMYVLIVEWFPIERRAIVGTLTETFWSLAVMLLALYGFLLPTWSHLQAALAGTGLLLTFAYFFTAEESLRWLLTSNKTQEAAAVSARVVKFNKIAKELPWDMEHELLLLGSHLRYQEDKAHYNFMDCFRTWRLAKITLCLTYIWFAMAAGYYGLSFSIPELFGNTALNLFIGGALEMIPNLACVYIVPRWGRKRPTIIFMFIGGVLCLLSCLLQGEDQASRIGKTCMVLTGRMAVAGGFCSIIVWTSELYPTVIRANGMGISMMGLRIGGVVAPQITLAARYTFPEFPVVVLGVLVLLGALAGFPLQETLDQKLPDTIKDAQNPAASTPPSQGGTEIREKKTSSAIAEGVLATTSTSAPVATKRRSLRSDSIQMAIM